MNEDKAGRYHRLKRRAAVVSLVWAVYLLARSILRLFMLQYSVDAFVAMNVITGFPIMTALMVWSVWYVTRLFRKSEEWGWALEAGDAAVELAEDIAPDFA